MVQTILCMKWGTRYGADYVNRLWGMIRRHTVRSTRLVCYTDDPNGIDAGVDIEALLPIELPEPIRWKPWRKLALWHETLPGASGDVLFLDLDVVVTGPLDPFFDHAPGAFCVIRNWTRDDGVGNTSCFRFRVGQAPHLVARMEAEGAAIRRAYVNEQIFVTREIGVAPEFWPDTWCVSFKHSLLPRWPMNFLKSASLPETARVVVFTGKPDPDEARDGRWPAPLWKRSYKHVRPTPWIAEHWRA